VTVRTLSDPEEDELAIGGRNWGLGEGNLLLRSRTAMWIVE
jgi:hypothetical protein